MALGRVSLPRPMMKANVPDFAQNLDNMYNYPWGTVWLW